MFGMFPCILFLAAFAYAMGTTPPSFGLLRMLINKFEFKPQHCGDILRAGGATSGVYTLFHDAAGPWGQRVYCDMDTDGGGWTDGTPLATTAAICSPLWTGTTT
ncbi:angiopoietin-2-like [Amblyomma americanum]